MGFLSSSRCIVEGYQAPAEAARREPRQARALFQGSVSKVPDGINLAVLQQRKREREGERVREREKKMREIKAGNKVFFLVGESRIRVRISVSMIRPSCTCLMPKLHMRLARPI